MDIPKTVIITKTTEISCETKEITDSDANDLTISKLQSEKKGQSIHKKTKSIKLIN